MPVPISKKIHLATVTTLLVAASAAKAQTFNASTTDVLVQLGKGNQQARAAALAPRAGGARFTDLKSISSTGWARLRLPAGQPVTPALISRLSRELGVKVVPNYFRRAYIVPNDELYKDQWGLTRIAAPRAWNVTTGTQGAVVAVIDSGVKAGHPDLAANMWTNPGESGKGRETNGIDDDGDGYIDDVHGVGNVNGVASGNATDLNGHGTRVAGIIGAVGKNGIGVAGVNWSTKIMSVRFMDENTRGTDADAIAGIEYVLAMKQKGVNIKAVNCSWGGPDYNKALQDAFDALDAAGILAVCAAGNGTQDSSDGVDIDTIPDYPSSFTTPGIISVAASDTLDTRPFFSNYGATSVDLAAPGVGILSTSLQTAYASDNGTSLAAPFVTGSVALIAALNPNAKPDKVKQRILATVDKFPQWTNQCVSGGRLNLNRALHNAIYSISGQVFRINGNHVKIPLAGARVFVNGTVLTNTDEDGNYKLDYLSSGDYNLVVKRPGFTFPTKFTHLPQDSAHVGFPNAIRNFEGTTTSATYYTISGTAFGNHNQPAAGIQIYLNSLTEPIAVTDSSGNYLIKQRPAETFALTARGGNLDWTSQPTSQTLPTTGLTTSPNGKVNFHGTDPDRSPPIITITTPANESVVTKTSFSAAGSATDPAKVAAVYAKLYRNVNGALQFRNWIKKTWVNTSSDPETTLTIKAQGTAYNWTIQFPPLENGEYHLAVWGLDGNGNLDPSFVESKFTVLAGGS